MTAFHAKGFSVGVKLALSPTIRREWQSRCIADVIPALDGYSGEPAAFVDMDVAAQIAADCRFYINPKAVDATASERAAYRALLAQCESTKVSA